MGILLAALLGGFFGFNAVATPDRVEQIMEDSLRKRYPGAQIDATVEGKRGKDVVKGRFRRVRLEMSHLGDVDSVPLEPGPPSKQLGKVDHFDLALRDFTFDHTPIESATVSVDDISYDLGALKAKNQLRIVNTGIGTAHLTLAAAALEELLYTRLDNVQDAHLHFQDGRIHVNGKKVLPIIHLRVPFHFWARPEVRHGNEVWLTGERAAFEDTTGLSLSVSSIFKLKQWNPIYVFDRDRKWPFEVQVTEIIANEDKLEVNANLRFGQPAPGPTPGPLPGPTPAPPAAAAPAAPAPDNPQ